MFYSLFCLHWRGGLFVQEILILVECPPCVCCFAYERIPLIKLSFRLGAFEKLLEMWNGYLISQNLSCKQHVVAFRWLSCEISRGGTSWPDTHGYQKKKKLNLKSNQNLKCVSFINDSLLLTLYNLDIREKLYRKGNLGQE